MYTVFLILTTILFLTTTTAHDHSLSCGSAHAELDNLQETNAFIETWSERRRALQEDGDNESLSFVVPVCFHVIRPTNDNETKDFLDASHLQIQLDGLNRGFSQSSCCNPEQHEWCEPDMCSVNTGFTFEMAQLNDNGELDLALGINPSTTAGSPCITRSYNDEWYESAYGGAPQLLMQSILRQGDATVLNVYYTDLRDPFGALKVIGGVAKFPEDYGLSPKLDGIFVSIRTILPRDENEDPPETFHTIVHETGHWLGLFHVFDQWTGCTGDDSVADTPIQKVPSSACDIEKDTCPNSPGTDSIFNFMDYTRDSCSFEFTTGQVERMQALMSSVRQAYRERELIEATVEWKDGIVSVQPPRGTLLVPPVDLGAFQTQYYRISFNRTATVTCRSDGLRLRMRKNAPPDVSLSLYDCTSESGDCTILYADEEVFAVVQATASGVENFQLRCVITALDNVISLILNIPQQVTLPSQEYRNSALYRLEDLPQGKVISCVVGPPGAGTMSIEFDYNPAFLERVLPQDQCHTEGSRCTQEILASQEAIYVAVSSTGEEETNLSLICNITPKMPDIALQNEVASPMVRLEQYGLQIFELDIEKQSHEIQCVASSTTGFGTLSLHWAVRPQVIREDPFYVCRTESLEVPCNASYFGIINVYYPAPRLFAVVEAATVIDNLSVVCSIAAKSIETIESGVTVGPMSLESRKDKVFELHVSASALVECFTNATSSIGLGEVDMYFKLDEPLDIAMKSRANCSAETSLSFETCSMAIPDDSISSSIFVSLIPFNGPVDGVTLVCRVNMTKPLRTTAPVLIPTSATQPANAVFVQPVQMPMLPVKTTLSGSDTVVATSGLGTSSIVARAELGFLGMVGVVPLLFCN